MAARRSKSQARRNPSNGLPGWAWLVLGILATLLVVLAVPRLLKSDGSGDGFFRPRPNPDALPARVNENGDAIAPDTAQDTPAAKQPAADRPKPTQYDFYTLLPGEGVPMSDAELAAIAKAEANAQAAAEQSAATNTSVDPGALPPPIADNAPTANAAPGTATITPSAQATGSATPVSEARYILQAGAFGGSGDAETVKARIAMLGLNARVESAQIGGKTVYRVRMGPYGSASELADAKAKLANGGLPAMAVRAK